MRPSLLPPAPPDDARAARGSALVATALTGLAILVVGLALTRQPVWSVRPVDTAAGVARAEDERVVFLPRAQQLPAPPPIVRSAPAARLDAAPVAAAAPADRGPESRPDTAGGGDPMPPRGAESISTGAARAPSASPVFRVPSPLAGSRALGAADRDTAVRAIGRGLPAFPRLRPTQALYDSMAHEATQELSLRRDARRPPPIPFVAQGGFDPRVRAKRVRDSVLHAANLERLRRIADSAGSRQRRE